MQSSFTLDAYLCDASGAKIDATTKISPGDKVNVCLEGNAGEGAKVVDTRSVSFKNRESPLLGLDLIDASGNIVDSTTTSKDCTTTSGKCRISTTTVPSLYEYIDSNGNLQDVSGGVYMSGKAVYRFSARRRYLQDQVDTSGFRDPSLQETIFIIPINLATPPDRSQQWASAATNAFDFGRTVASFVSLPVALCLIFI